jgi:hypothetical protein
MDEQAAAYPEDSQKAGPAAADGRAPHDEHGVRTRGQREDGGDPGKGEDAASSMGR